MIHRRHCNGFDTSVSGVSRAAAIPRLRDRPRRPNLGTDPACSWPCDAGFAAALMRQVSHPVELRTMARLLLIDDDAEVRMPLAVWLRRHGHDVVEAGNGVEGLAHLEEGSFDVVVTDIIMPDMEGIETIMRVRKRWPDLPVVAISGGGSGEPSQALRPASRLGAHATLRKPFRPSVLGELIDKLLAGDLAPPGEA